ncbi:LysR family transcriptional regulator [Rhodobium gokarnense]|nr:LysR substrate-binding domain-containing protein [Rhodobium gokarnense]
MNVPSAHISPWSRIPVKALLVFESVVRHKSVMKAGNEFCITHSAVSKNISILEDYLGHTLFNRTGRTLMPTAEAEVLAKAVREAESLIDGALAGIAERCGTVELDIVAPATFAMRWLIPRLPDFTGRHPHVHPQIRPTHTPDNWQTIPFDIAVRRGADMPAHFLSRPLFTETIGLVATRCVAERLRGARGALRPGDLVAADTRPGELAAWLDAAGFGAKAAEAAVHYPHNYIALEAALAGRGAMVVPLEIVPQLLDDGHLTEVFPGRTLTGRTYHVGHDPRSPKRPYLDAFVAWLEMQTPMPAAA